MCSVSGVGWSAQVSSGFLGGGESHAYELPDLSGVAGWQVAWESIRAADPVRWQVSALVGNMPFTDWIYGPGFATPAGMAGLQAGHSLRWGVLDSP